MRILCFGDIHVGITPSSFKSETGLTPSPAKALRQVPELATRLKADLILFTGDIVDGRNKAFEGFNAFSNSLKELEQLGIPVCAICGNHDFDVLPKIAAELPFLTLLGKNSNWDSVNISARNGEQICIQGWSFSTRHHPGNPFESYSVPDTELPIIGLVHCHAGAVTSRHAPVTLEDFRNKPPIAWILGHIHKHHILSTTPLVSYPGVLQSLDPGEPGSHGPLLLETEGNTVKNYTHIPIAELQYETIEYNCSSFSEEKGTETLSLDALSLTNKAVKEWLSNRKEAPQAAAFSIRLRITGEIENPELLYQIKDDFSEKEITQSGYVFYIERAEIACRPKCNLETLAEHSDPPGLLAQKLITLEKSSPTNLFEELIEESREEIDRLQETYPAAGDYGDGRKVSKEKIRRFLLDSGYYILYKLLEQRQ